MMLLEGKRALITGGSAGIGRAVAFRFASQGAKIALMGTHAGRGKNVVQELLKTYPNCEALFVPTDVSNAQSVEEGTKKVLEAFSTIDILVNNAGITRDQLLIRMSEEDWDRVMETNVKSCYLLCRIIAKQMMKARKGKIIQMSSVIGLMGNKGQTNYAASKAAMIGFTKSLAKELASRSVYVNAIAPGFIETSMTDALTDEIKTEILRHVPLGRLGTPEEVADVALFLAGPLSNYMTGQVIAVDGGMIM